MPAVRGFLDEEEAAKALFVASFFGLVACNAGVWVFTVAGEDNIRKMMAYSA